MEDQKTKVSQKKSGSEQLIERVVSTLIAVGRFLGLVWAPKSRHERDYSDAAKVPDGADDAFVPVTEFRDSDEGELFNDVMTAFSQDCLAYAKGSGNDPGHEDKHWGYTKGLVEGTLDITGVQSLPEECQVGLFQSNGTYEVIARPNFLRDKELIKVSRLSLKIKTGFDVPNVYTLDHTAPELDLLFSEGIRQGDTESRDQDGQGFFFRDARQLRYLAGFASRPVKSAFSLLQKSNGDVFVCQRAIMSSALDRLYTAQQSRKNWAEKDYYSAGPYRLGNVLIKYALRTRQESQASTRSSGSGSPAKDQGAWFNEWKVAGEPAIFDLCIQVARFGAIPTSATGQGNPCKAVMATEFTDLVWDEDISEFQTVGTLTLEPASNRSDPWYFAGRDRWYPRHVTQVPALRFNAWNTLPDMEPVGQLFRARKQVHAHHRETRLRHTFNAQNDPQAFCPFRRPP